MVDREQLQQMSKWAGFVGIMSIIYGAFSALSGLVMMIVGAIPGIIIIILGLKLRAAKRYADELLAAPSDDETRLNLLFTNLNSYFKIQGILIIVLLVLVILSLVFVVFLGGLSYMSNVTTQEFTPQRL